MLNAGELYEQALAVTIDDDRYEDDEAFLGSLDTSPEEFGPFAGIVFARFGATAAAAGILFAAGVAAERERASMARVR